MFSERQWISMFGKWSIDQGGCRTKWHNCIPQDIDTSCQYDNDPIWFPQAMDVTESHHIVLIKCSDLNRTTSTFVLKLSPLKVATFDVWHLSVHPKEAISFGKGVSIFMSFFLFSCINTVFFSLFLLQYCFRHCAFCNLDWGITIYHHFK
jgi:hypothetical protein